MGRIEPLLLLVGVLIACQGSTAPSSYPNSGPNASSPCGACAAGEQCVERRAYSYRTVWQCEHIETVPDRCHRGDACGDGKTCCHEFRNACPGGLCEGSPLDCFSACAD